MFISPSFTRMAQAGWKSKFINCFRAFPSMFVSSLREFPENCVYKHGELNWFIEYLHRKLSAANFLSFDIENARKNAVIGFAD